MDNTTLIGTAFVIYYIIFIMSDDQDAIYIGPEEDQMYPEIISVPADKDASRSGEYRVAIKDFEIIKESYIMATETQIYKVRIFLDGKELMTIHRRFSDFEFLFDILQERYPGLIIPGFQEKSLLSYFQAKMSPFKTTFIEMRMQFLIRFLTKILNLKALKGTKEIQNFLSVDEQFQIFKKANLGEIKKRGIIGNLISTAGNLFKTKKVDSKYEKILEQAFALLKQLQKVESDLAKYPDSIASETMLVSALKQSNPEVFEIERMSKKFQQEVEFSKQQGIQMLNTLDELMYCQLDLKFFMLIIERRYELKQNGDYKAVDQLQKTFEAQKDGFLEFVKNQIERVKCGLHQQIIAYRKKLLEIWQP